MVGHFVTWQRSKDHCLYDRLAMGFWSNWTALSSCSVSCGVGFQYQTRQCLGAGFGCVGEAINTVICNTSVACPGMFRRGIMMKFQ